MLIKNGIDACHAKIYLLGMTFKEDCPDIRNSRPVDVYHALESYGIHPVAVDPVADSNLFQREYGIALHAVSDVKQADCLVFLVKHAQFLSLGIQDLAQFYNQGDGNKVIIDVKSIFSRYEAQNAGYSYWNL
jgi:UDP-N-acetyl-D-galactosamine dehydrogenase